ncbi:MAG: PH domain-containing protein [Actinomycetota bacterium]|nr:PH domain-containing protein [Actinomycetota bacterium]
MAFSTKLLAEGERVVLDLHPHWKTLIAPVVVLLAVVGGGSFLLAWMPDGSFHQIGQGAVAVVSAGLLWAYVLVPFLRWRTTHFVVTDRRVLVRTGIIARTGRDVPLTRINDITFSHTMVERFLGCGTLVVESAGERGQVVLKEVPAVEAVQRRLYELVEATDQARGRSDPPTGTGPASGE